MELSNFISMIQYEILKSFDFASIMQDNIQENETTKIQLAIETAEVEIPLIFDSKKITTTLKNDKLDNKYIAKTSIDIPFNTDLSKLKVQKPSMVNLDSVKKSSAIRSTKTEGDVILVKIANSDSKKDSDFDKSLIGKIKLTIKPILK
ncbi:hypothetical protein Aeqsu_2557 [Aequorivita sublithincola DSM 14238]|uniref:Uncharacterized protein n=2 Tax=Aequorivita TaxID=153265 RepID=I3YYE4_AEQSU|nr:hypothetical protein Aeqsu_2557 [Aequorivita sublithincola DSM 14238]